MVIGTLKRLPKMALLYLASERMWWLVCRYCCGA
jgi:hypothetical protein